MFHSAAIGAPVSGGVAIVFPDFSVSSLWNPNSRGQTPENKRVQGKWGCHTPTAFYAPTPLLSLGHKISGPQGHEKHPGFGLSYRLRKPGGPVRRIAVNRDPFRKLRFGKFPQGDVPIYGLLHPSVLVEKFQVLPV